MGRGGEIGGAVPRPEVLLAGIRALAAHSDQVVFTYHALERMEQRDILDVDVLRTLRQGRIDGPIEPTATSGDWKAKVVFRLCGSRDAGVVTVVAQARRLIVLTVEWEDLR